MKFDDNMNLHIKEKMRKIFYPYITDYKPLSQLVKIKGAPMKVKPTPSENSTMWTPSYFEHVDETFPYSPTSKSIKK